MIRRIENLKEYIFEKHHHQFRRYSKEVGIYDISKSFAKDNINPIKRSALCFSTLLDEELPVILPGERIVFTRTISDIPEIYTEEEWRRINDKYYIHERGTVCNISPDYATTIEMGLEARKNEIV